MVKKVTRLKKKKFELKSIFDKMKYIDKLVLILAVALFALGVIMIFSITSISIYNGVEDDSLFFVRKTLVSAFIGVCGMMFLALIPYKTLKTFGFLATIGCPSILILTLLVGEGSGASNVRSWIKIGPLSIQPAEFVKVGIILSLAWLITKCIRQKKYHLKSFKSIGPVETVQTFAINLFNYLWNSFFKVLLFLGLCVGLVLIQPDLGSAIIILGVGGIIFICSGISAKTIGVLMGIGASLGAVALPLLAGYQRERFDIWLDPFNHDKGLQNVMGYTAIALGGMFGVGIGKSTQKYGYVIEPHNDFIVTILVEELGVITVLLVMIAYLTITIRCFLTAFKCKDIFGSLVCIGVGAIFLIQPAINLGGASGAIPLTGVTLPFISYGGSSLMTLFFGLGMYFNVRIETLSRLKREEKEIQRELSSIETNVIPFKSL